MFASAVITDPCSTPAAVNNYSVIWITSYCYCASVSSSVITRVCVCVCACAHASDCAVSSLKLTGGGGWGEWSHAIVFILRLFLSPGHSALLHNGLHWGGTRRACICSCTCVHLLVGDLCLCASDGNFGCFFFFYNSRVLRTTLFIFYSCVWLREGPCCSLC